MKGLFLTLTALFFSINVNASGFEIEKTDVQMALVHFDTDVSMLDSAARISLGKLKMTADSEVVIIGKTDARGSDVYNVALGLRRAESVASFLNASNVSVSSVGETEATETLKDRMRSDRVALVKVITKVTDLNPLFGDASMNLQGPTSHLQYNTVPLGQGAKRAIQPRM